MLEWVGASLIVYMVCGVLVVLATGVEHGASPWHTLGRVLVCPVAALALALGLAFYAVLDVAGGVLDRIALLPWWKRWIP